jgi:aminopeptidase N
VAVYDDQGWDISIPPPYGDATYLDTSLFQVKVTVPQEMAVVASGSVATETPNRNQSKTVTLVSGPIRDFYMVIDPTYQPIVDNVDGITVTSYAPADLEAGSKLALAYTVDALTVFNQKFGPYPYTEFDIVATPTTAGGVEYPGIVVIAERLYNQEGGFFQHAVGHEVAHQWWYGMVGNNQVLEPWLDEALTNYSTAIYWELAEGEDIGEQIISSYFVSPYEQARSQDRDRAVLGPVENFSQGEYGTFVYGKGPLFFHAVRETYGDDQFFEIMQLYLNTHRYQNVTAEDLWATIESVTGQSIQPLIETWLQHP